jgi:hypothetical protein
MAAADEIKKLKETTTAAKAEMDRLLGSAEGLERNAIKASKAYKDQVIILKEGNEQIRERLNLQKQSVDALVQQEGKLKGLTGLQASLVDLDRKRIALQDTIDGSYSDTHDALNSIASLNQELLSLSSEDVIAKRHIEDSISNQLYDLIGMEGITDEIVQNLDAQFQRAAGIASLTERQQNLLNKQHQILDGIRDTIQGTIETTITLYGNLQGALGGVVTGMGFVVDKIGQANRELGTTLFQTDGVARKAGILSFIFEDAVGTAKNLSSELGSTDRATFGLQTNVGLMAMNMGISNSEAATLVGSFSRLNGNSTDVASDMIATSREFAKQNNIIPSQLMGDLAASAEEFALFGKQGGKNILEAAGYAAKLGVNMKTLSGISRGLLDFESSITKELELGAMLGRNVNLNRARALAYEGKIKESVKETLNALGGVDAFNRMDVFQREQTADLLGISVAELEKMVKYQEQAGTLGGVINEKFSQLGEFIDGGLNKYLGTSLKSLGGMITASAQVGADFAQMGLNVSGMAQKIPGIKKLFGGASAAVPSNGIPFTSAANQMNPVQNGPMPNPAGKGGIMQSMGKINMSAVLKGAAAMVLVAGSVYILGKALQEFKSVGLGEVGVAAAGMLLLGAAMAGLGAIMMSPIGAGVLIGAASMLVIAGAIWVLGKAIQEMANGFSMLSGLSDQLIGLISIIPGMIALAGAFSLLGASLGVMAIGGIAALPVMLGLGAVGAGLGFLFNAFGDEEETGAIEQGSLSEYNTQMLSKMDELIQVTKAAKDVYLDREKVTGLVVSTSEKNSVNKFSLNNA